MALRRRCIVVARNEFKTPRLHLLLPIAATAALLAGGARADVHDPLDNTDTFDNAEEYNGDIASNTGNISNNEPGVWTGTVSNGTGLVTNSWIWNGDVASNAGSITNNADAVWTGDVVTNDSQLWNGGTWNGDVLGNSNIIYTLEGSTWTGNVVAQTDGTVFNMGTWTGDVETNNGYVYQWGGAWVGDVLSNDRDILVVAGTWTGDVVTNAGSLVNRAAWTGDVLANTGTVENDAGGVWKGDVTNGTGTLHNYGSWIGNVKGNLGSFYNDGADAVWTGDVMGTDSQIMNENGAIWNGDVRGNNNAIFNEAGSTWNGDVIANGGGSNARALIDNYGTWNGDVKGNAVTVYNDFAWNGDVTGNAGKVINYAGVWTGDVTGNTGMVSNRSGVIWNGDVTGNDGTVENRIGGTWNGSVLANNGTINNKGVWTGDVLGNAGGIENDAGASWKGDVTNGATGGVTNYGSWTGNVVANDGFFYNSGADAVWTGDVLTTNNQILNQNGGAWKGDILANNNAIFNQVGSTWTGDVIDNGGGSNPYAQINNEATWIGDVVGNHGSVYSTGTWTGKVLGNNHDIILIDSIWNGDVVANANGGRVINLGGVWTGDVLANSGLILNVQGVWDDVDAGPPLWIGDVASNAGIIDNRAEGTWTGAVLSNAGTINTKGIWNGAFTNAGTVNAQNRINGAFDNSGTLNVTGSLAGITTLTNTGTIDMRGNGAAQTLSAANAIFGPNSVYALDVDAAGNSDTIAIAGTAALGGTVRVAVATGTPYNASTVYTILTADNVVGEFQSVSTDLTFLTPRLSYETDAVELTLLRNDVGFGSVGTTANQQATGGGVETLGNGNDIYDAVLWLNADQAAHAFDALSGEAYNSIEGAQVEDAGLLADILTGRLDEALDASAEGARVASNDEGFMPSMPGRSTRVWGQVYGRQSSVATGGGTAGMASTTGGFAGGFDGLVGDWRLGMMLHIGRSRNEVSGLNSSADSTDYGLGAYAGHQWGRTRLSLGASYTRHDIDADRHVAFMGFTDTVSADYASGTAQVFGKLSQRFDIEAVSLSPYASLAYVRDDTDGFIETGGAAALTSESSHLDAAFTTIGLEAGRKFTVGDGIRMGARGNLGWRHIFADAPESVHRFADGADFSVSGAPIDGDALVGGAGLDIGASSSLDVSYETRIGGGNGGHALTGTWTMRF